MYVSLYSLYTRKGQHCCSRLLNKNLKALLYLGCKGINKPTGETDMKKTSTHIKRKQLLLYIIAGVASLGGLLSGFDTGVISGALLYINETWELSALAQGWIVSSALVGATTGAAINGILADRYGRKKIIMATASVFAIGSVCCALATSIKWLIIGRIILGVAIGMVNFVIPLYLSEISPQKVRGMLVSLYQLAITVGILFSYLINRVFALVEFNWRWMLGAGVIPALVLLIGIGFLGDTPRWLISRQREKEAENIFKKIEPDCNPKALVKEIKASLKEQTKCCCHRLESWMYRPIFAGVTIMAIQICTGINTIIYYAATIFKSAGFTDNVGALYASVGVGFVNFLMTFVAIFYTDKVGRKPLLYAGLSGMTLSLYTLSLSFYLSQNLGYETKWISMVSIVIFVACFAFSLGPVAWILISEIMPLSIRGLAMSIATMSNFICNFAVALFFPMLLQKVGEPVAFTIFGIIGLISLFYVRKYIPETKGKSLEEIEKKWKNFNTKTPDT